MVESRRGPIWHLPVRDTGVGPVSLGVPPGESGDVWHETKTASGRVLKAPRLTDREAADIAASVRAAALEARSVRTHAEVVHAVSTAAMRLADGSDRVGREAVHVLSSGLGWSEEAAREVLAGMSREWSESALSALVEEELGDPALLEGFAPDPSREGRRRMAIGPPLILQLHAGNVPGVPVTGAMLALIARSGVLAKTGEDEPGLLPLFARTLAEEDALLASCVAVTWWPGEEAPPALARWGKEAGKAIVYGGDSAVRVVREKIPPDVELIVYGPRTGIAVFLSDAPEQAAALLARDVCAYEQRGCVSPRLAFVVAADPLEVSERIAGGMKKEAARVRPPPLSDEEAVALRSARAECEFAGLESRSTRVLGPLDLSWTVFAHEEAGVGSTALPRAIWVYGVPSIEALGVLLEPFEGRIQSIGYAGTEREEDLARLAARLGVSRVSELGEMAWPPPDWRHEGRHRLLPLLSWTDWETVS